MPVDLNLKWGQRFSVLASGWAVLALILPVVSANAAWRADGGFSGSFGGSCALAVAALNRDFYRFLARVRSPWFSLHAFPLHCLYFLCGGTGFAAGLTSYVWSRLPLQNRMADKPLCADPEASPGELVSSPGGLTRDPTPSCSPVRPGK